MPHCTHKRCVRKEGRHDQRDSIVLLLKRTKSRTDRDCPRLRHCCCGLRHITVMNLSLSRELKSFSSDPIEWAISVRERWAERSEHRSKGSHGPDFMPWPPCPYAIDDEWEANLHEAIGAPWPCPTHDRFEAMWRETITSVQARVRDVGRGAFGKEGWADGDTALARIVYCMTLHMQPEHLLETGVARGITTRFVLEAIAENGHGHLWSIDLPPPGEPEIHDQIGMAIPDRLRPLWTYVSGSSRRRLRPLRPKPEQSTCSYTTAGTPSGTSCSSCNTLGLPSRLVAWPSSTTSISICGFPHVFDVHIPKHFRS